MLKACSVAGEGLLQEARNRLGRQFSHLLSSYLQAMDTRLVVDIFADLSTGEGAATSEAHAVLNASEMAELRSFAGAHRQYESCQFTLRSWLYRCGLEGKLARLNADQQPLLISKVLQNNGWEQCQQGTATTVSPRSLLKQMRDAVGLLLDEKPG